MKSAHIIVSGRVQGVFFRSSVKQVAIAQGIRGFVKNTSDGCVEIVAQGQPDALTELINFCNRGPPGAKVENVEITYIDYEECNSFQIGS